MPELHVFGLIDRNTFVIDLENPMARATVADMRSGTFHDVSWAAAVFAGVMAGLAWVAWRILASWWAGEPPWRTGSLIASLVLGGDVVQTSKLFDPKVTGTAALVHFGLSIVLACLIAPALARLRMMGAIVTGVLYGALLYVLNLHVIAPLFLPWMTELSGAITLVSHLLFGLVLGYCYKLADAARQKSRGTRPG
jgi:hypothetical protein